MRGPSPGNGAKTTFAACLPSVIFGVAIVFAPMPYARASIYHDKRYSVQNGLVAKLAERVCNLSYCICVPKLSQFWFRNRNSDKDRHRRFVSNARHISDNAQLLTLGLRFLERRCARELNRNRERGADDGRDGPRGKGYVRREPFADLFFPNRGRQFARLGIRFDCPGLKLPPTNGQVFLTLNL